MTSVSRFHKFIFPIDSKWVGGQHQTLAPTFPNTTQLQLGRLVGPASRPVQRRLQPAIEPEGFGRYRPGTSVAGNQPPQDSGRWSRAGGEPDAPHGKVRHAPCIMLKTKDLKQTHFFLKVRQVTSGIPGFMLSTPLTGAHNLPSPLRLGKLLLLMSLVWLYFSAAEHLTVWYGNQPAEYAVLEARIYGKFAPYFWSMVALNFVIPFVLLGIRRLRTIRNVAICGFTVVAGMWLERYLIVVNTLSYPRLASAWGTYSPTWVEISISIGTFAGMILLYLIFAKLFPIIEIWEYKPDVHQG